MLILGNDLGKCTGFLDCFIIFVVCVGVGNDATAGVE